MLLLKMKFFDYNVLKSILIYCVILLPNNNYDYSNAVVVLDELTVE